MILKSNNIVIVGEGFEAIQLAASIRSYLDDLSIYSPKIAILSEKESYLKYMSTLPEEHIKELLKQNWISLIFKANIKNVIGTHWLNEIQFNLPGDDKKKV